MPYMFLGEQRSKTAIRRGWYWTDARVSAKTLQEALAALGLVYGREYLCRNLFDDDGTFRVGTVEHFRLVEREGFTLVSMGSKVDVILTHYAVPHLAIIHPAARGSIRAKAVYQAHVAAVLHDSLPTVLQARGTDAYHAHRIYQEYQMRPITESIERAQHTHEEGR